MLFMDDSPQGLHLGFLLSMKFNVFAPQAHINERIEWEKNDTVGFETPTSWSWVVCSTTELKQLSDSNQLHENAVATGLRP